MAILSVRVLVLVFMAVSFVPSSTSLDFVSFDVFQVMKLTAGVIFKAWDLVRDLPDTNAAMEHPLLKSSQREVLRRLKEVSSQIYQSEQAHSERISMAISAINNFVEGNMKITLRFNEVNDIMKDISALFKEMQQYETYKDRLERVTLLSFVRNVVLPSEYSVYHQMEKLHAGVQGSVHEKNLFHLLLQNYQVSTEQQCELHQSAQQFLYAVYTDIALTELKGYTMMEFSWMILRLNGEGNFTQEAMLMRQQYHDRITKMVRMLREVMRRADRAIWRCDTSMYKKGSNYDEVTRLLQGYIENEVEMSKSHECWSTCDNYAMEIRSDGCFKEKFCSKQERCTGKIYDCTFVDSDMDICQSPRQSPRRYEFIKYENAGIYGKGDTCERQTTKVESWWRYLFWHCSYCFCYCDDMNSPKTDRYFNLRPVESNIKANRVVTGLRFKKVNRIFHLQIQEGELMPLGEINSTSLFWKPVDNYTLNDKGVKSGRDYHTLKYRASSIDLDDIETEDPAYVVTGIRFRVLGTHLNLEARLSEFDYATGQLLNPEVNSFWKSNDNTDVSGDKRQKIQLSDEGIPIMSAIKAVPMSGHNQYIDFVPSSRLKDLAQSTIPFIDTQGVISNPPVPLSGVGVFYKGKPANGGFLAPRLFTYDFVPHIQEPQIETIKGKDVIYNIVQLREANTETNEV